MSFTSSIKDEISKLNISDTEKISELAGIVSSSCLSFNELVISTENNSVARRIFTLYRDIYAIYPKITVRRGYNYNKKMVYILSIQNKVDHVIKSLGLSDKIIEDFIVGDDELLRSYLRGVFMMCGSINDPKKSRYHLEFNFNNNDFAMFIHKLLNKYDLNSKVLRRGNSYMVYVKEAEKIGDYLRMIGAYNAVMYYEDIRIYRDHKNMTNRINNCEQANVDRIIETANNQLKDIEYIEKKCGLELLSEKEQVAAIYRKKYKDSSLTELAEIISMETGEAITKSGLYHRFHKIKLFVQRLEK